MKRISPSTRGFVALAFCALTAVGCRRHRGEGGGHWASAPLARSDEQCLSIVGWNDMHGQIDADLPEIATGYVPAGGVIAVGDALDNIRSSAALAAEPVFVVDAGDEFTGPLESSLAEGAPISAAYALLGVDAATFGNHEFDFGPVGYDRVRAAEGVGDEAGADGPRGALLARLAAAPFPYVNANIRRVGGAPLGWANVKASTIVERGGFKVGIVGYTTRDTPSTTLKPNVVGLDFVTDAGKNVAAQVRALREAHASPVVLIAHASIDGDLPQNLDDPRDPKGASRKGELADLLASMGTDVPDLIIAGHRHAWMLGRVRGVPTVSSGEHGVGISRSRFCRSTHAAPDAPMQLASIERIVTLASDPPRTDLGKRVKAAMQPFLANVRAQADAVVATIGKTCIERSQEGPRMLEQMTAAILEHVADAKAAPKGVPAVALSNAGGLRAPLHAGVVHFSDLYQTFPFENAVAVCATTRAGFERALDNALKKPSTRERMPFGLAGATLHVKRRTDGGLDRVSIAFHDGKAENANDPVWLALSDFILWGGDGILDGVTCSEQATSQMRIRDAWRQLLSREGSCDGPMKDIVIDHP